MIPNINLDTLQELHDKYALKGAEDAIKEYYTSYKSPYKQAIQAYLEGNQTVIKFEIPNFVDALNTQINNKINGMVNNTIALTLMEEFDGLFKDHQNIKFSDLLKAYKKENDEIPRVEWIERERFLLKFKIDDYLFYFRENESTELITITSFYNTDYSETNMRVKKNDVTIELPAFNNRLYDDFTKMVYSAIIHKTPIEIDVDYWEGWIDNEYEYED